MCSHQIFQVPVAGENVCLATKGAKVIAGCDRHRGMISGDSEHQGRYDGYGYATIFHNNEGIVFQLADATYLNHFIIRLYDAYDLDTGYTIEVAMELREWDMLCDYSKHVCRSWQRIWFPARVIRYIRLKGVWTKHNAFLVSYVAAYFDRVGAQDFPLHPVFNLMVPKKNVARFDYGARILDGNYKEGNSLFDEVTKTIPIDKSVQFTTTEGGTAQVQLGQPYVVSSFRFLLAEYSEKAEDVYYCEVSTDGSDWCFVRGTTTGEYGKWNLVEFNPRPVVFIRIRGDSWRPCGLQIYHFECPSQE